MLLPAADFSSNLSYDDFAAIHSFVAILFVDAVQRMVKVMSEGETARDNRGVQDVRTETNYAARKFYSQRNMYLTGFTLFLSL